MTEQASSSFETPVGSAAKPALSLQIVLPSVALRPYVSSYYLSEIDSDMPISDLSVPEWGSIRLICSGGFTVDSGADTGLIIDEPVIQGPSSKAVRFTVQRCIMVGIGLLPLGFARFWNADVSRIADKSDPLGSIIDGAGAWLRAALNDAASADEMFGIVDSFMRDVLRDAPPTEASNDVARAHALLNDPTMRDTDAMAQALGRHPSALARLCKRRFGFPPKLLLRRQRFLRMLDALHARPYAEWPDFLDPQYTDQSHMIRDFRHFMGTSPTQYLALPRMVQKASAAHRSQALGGALQGLA